MKFHCLAEIGPGGKNLPWINKIPHGPNARLISHDRLRFWRLGFTAIANTARGGINVARER